MLYRCLKATQAKNKESEASDRLIKLKDIRKDCAKKSITTTGILLDSTPSISVEANSNSGLATDNLERGSIKRDFKHKSIKDFYQDDKGSSI